MTRSLNGAVRQIESRLIHLKLSLARSFCASLTHRNPKARWCTAISGELAILARRAHSIAWRWQYLAYNEMTMFSPTPNQVKNPNSTEATEATSTATNAASEITAVATRLRRRSLCAVVTFTFGNRVASAAREFAGMASPALCLV